MAKSKKKRVTFRLDAPDAKEVYLAGSFNDWDPGARALKRAKNGIWSTWTNLEPGSYEYRFVVDGEWRQDPECPDTAVNEFGSHNSILKV